MALVSGRQKGAMRKSAAESLRKMGVPYTTAQHDAMVQAGIDALTSEGARRTLVSAIKNATPGYVPGKLVTKIMLKAVLIEAAGQL